VPSGDDAVGKHVEVIVIPLAEAAGNGFRGVPGLMHSYARSAQRSCWPASLRPRFQAPA